MTDVMLTWSDYLVLRIIQKLTPMSEPSNTSGYHKQDWKHICWETHCLINYTTVEVNIWIQFSLNKKWVTKCYFLQLNSDLNKLLFSCNFKHLMCDLFYYFSSWIIAFIDSMTETIKKFLSTFYILNKLGNILFFSNLLEHSQNSFIGSSMLRTI